MNGICGFISLSGKHEAQTMLAQVKVMNSALYNPGSGFAYTDDFCTIGQSDCSAVTDSLVSFFYGELYNGQALADRIKAEENQNEAQIVLRGYEEYGSRFFESLSGKFVCVIYDRQKKTVRIVRAHVLLQGRRLPAFFYRVKQLACHRPGAQADR